MKIRLLVLLSLAGLVLRCSASGPGPEENISADTTSDAAADAVRIFSDAALVDSPLDVPHVKDVAEQKGDFVPLSEAVAEIESGQLGKPCSSQDDCVSGLCLETGAGGVCTDSCIEECPADWECKGVPLYGADPVFICVPEYWSICAPCNSDDECKADAGLCVKNEKGGKFCTVPCAGAGCPSGFLCSDDSVCLPEAGSCACRDDGDIGAEQECLVENDLGACSGVQFCQGTVGWAPCQGQEPIAEECNGVDDDCDGSTDEGFTDTDQDLVADCVDEDDDGDGFEDDDDNCPLLANLEQENLDGDLAGDLCDEDDDNDTVVDGDDNCPMLSNQDQADLDADGSGDMCDPDDDEDGIPDLTDNCPATSNPLQVDTDQDGLGDVCETDDDNDGLADGDDNCPLAPNTAQDNCDGDAMGDACDPDDDNDGTLDEADCQVCGASVFPGALEACNGLDDNCNSIVDEGTETVCLPYVCGGEGGCLSTCLAQEECGEGHFCDVQDSDGNGEVTECLAESSDGSPCTDDFECEAGYCGNGFCCAAAGGPCCAQDADCALLEAPAVCDAPATCTGHRMEGACNAANVCIAQQMADGSGCAGSLCMSGNHCAGNVVHDSKFCDAAGGCSQAGAAVQNCQGANPCCTYGCANGACTSAFSGTIECAYICFVQPIMCFCW
jgi:hypothetical protein